MGYDIDLYLENKLPGGRWAYADQEPNTSSVGPAAWNVLGFDGRDYGETAIAPERGLPPDVGRFVADRFDDAQDAQTGYWASWFTLAELLPHRARLGSGFEPVLAMMAEHGAPDDVRAVFWFTM